MGEQTNVKAVVQYNGSAYCGFQRQPQLPTIQEALEKAISTILREQTAICFAGRTDSGVHALHQVINFTSPGKLDHYVFRHQLNAILPVDIRVSSTADVRAEFNARTSAMMREYVYVILNRRYSSPFTGSFCWHIPEPLDLVAMQEAAKYLLGENDFSSFAAQSGVTGSNVREIFAADLAADPALDGSYITFTIKATAFLHHMVRNIIGTLVEIGEGKRKPGCIPELLAASDRRQAGRTAPAKGLFLANVDYGPDSPG